MSGGLNLKPFFKLATLLNVDFEEKIILFGKYRESDHKNNIQRVATALNLQSSKSKKKKFFNSVHLLVFEIWLINVCNPRKIRFALHFVRYNRKQLKMGCNAQYRES